MYLKILDLNRKHAKIIGSIVLRVKLENGNLYSRFWKFLHKGGNFVLYWAAMCIKTTLENVQVFI